MKRERLEDYVVSIPDFPEPGIIFRDITSVLQDEDGLQMAIDEMQKLVAGIEFDTLFSNGLYSEIGRNAIETADRIRTALIQKGYQLVFDSPTNQIFILLEKEQAKNLSEKIVMGFWENPDENHTIMRIATSWATKADDVDALIRVL